MTPNTKRQLKRTAQALDSIKRGKKFQIPGRKWIDPVDLNRGGFLRIDKNVTTLQSCDALEHHTHQWTSDDVQMICAVLRDQRLPQRLWIWIWHSDHGVHIIEPAGTEVEELDADLAKRFPNA